MVTVSYDFLYFGVLFLIIFSDILVTNCLEEIEGLNKELPGYNDL